jgi:HTH-type transcriptional regulator/antitoxin HigA
MMDVRPLHTESDYEWALAEVSRYFDTEPPPGSPDGDRFEVLLALLRDYEDKNTHIPAADPIEVLRFAIESMGKSQAQLAALLGSRSHASEVLNRKRRLTLDMIRMISSEWRIPIELLTPHYELAKDSA